MIAAQSKEVEDKLKAQYDDRIKQLQQQLEESRKVAGGTEPAGGVAPGAAAGPGAGDSRTGARDAPAARADPGAAADPAGAHRPPSPAPAQSAAAEPAPTPAPARQQVQAGDLVQAGPGVVRRRLSRRLDPRYPSAAQKLRPARRRSRSGCWSTRSGRVLEAQRVRPQGRLGLRRGRPRRRPPGNVHAGHQGGRAGQDVDDDPGFLPALVRKALPGKRKGPGLGRVLSLWRRKPEEAGFTGRPP